MALRLEKAFGVSMDLLLRMQAGYDAAQTRRRAAEIDVRRYRADLTPATD
jgi:plasmid maintenance system antidote protein VapI